MLKKTTQNAVDTLPPHTSWAVGSMWLLGLSFKWHKKYIGIDYHYHWPHILPPTLIDAEIVPVSLKLYVNLHFTAIMSQTWIRAPWWHHSHETHLALLTGSGNVMLDFQWCRRQYMQCRGTEQGGEIGASGTKGGQSPTTKLSPCRHFKTIMSQLGTTL